jgi:hypothetical protein
MRILVLGAGAVGVVLADVLGAAHSVTLASRRGEATVPGASRLRSLPGRRRGSSRPIPVVAVDTVVDLPWDLVICTYDTEAARLPLQRLYDGGVPTLATVSQVRSEIAAFTELAGARTAVIAPGFLADRPDHAADRPIIWWVPPGTPTVSVAGRRAPVRAAFRAAGVWAAPSTPAAQEALAARLMPYMAELTAQDGNWSALCRSTARPTAGAREALRALGARSLMPPAGVVTVGLRLAPRIAPFDLPDYAARHFLRHRGQTVIMLDDWIGASTAPTPALTELRAAVIAE